MTDFIHLSSCKPLDPYRGPVFDFKGYGLNRLNVNKTLNQATLYHTYMYHSTIVLETRIVYLVIKLKLALKNLIHFAWGYVLTSLVNSGIADISTAEC